MKTKILPEEILKNIPIRYRFLDELNFEDEKQFPSVKTTKNTYYKSNKILCYANYRKTSKLLIEDDAK